MRNSNRFQRVKKLFCTAVAMMGLAATCQAITITMDLAALFTPWSEGYIAFDLRWGMLPEEPLHAYSFTPDAGHNTRTVIWADDGGDSLSFEIWDPMRTGGERLSGPLSFGEDRLAAHLDLSSAPSFFQFAPIAGEPWGMRVILGGPDLAVPPFADVAEASSTFALLALALVALGFAKWLGLAR
jgi:hypothetical protein